MLDGIQIIPCNYCLDLSCENINTQPQGRKEVGNNICEPCLAGHYQEDEGKDYCDTCREGTVSTNNGASYCVPCPKVVLVFSVVATLRFFHRTVNPYNPENEFQN